MKLLVSAVLMLFALAGNSRAAESQVGEKYSTNGLVTVSFWINGTECPQCVDDLHNALYELPGQPDLRMSYMTEFAVITLDPKKANYHQIAQRIADTVSKHGGMYRALLKLEVPEYAQSQNTARVDAAFKKFADFAEVNFIDRQRGRVYFHFKPLTAEVVAKHPGGLDFEALRREIQSPPPKGLGLKFTVVHDFAAP